MTSRYLFDSHALLAFFQEEKGTEVVAKILRRALKQRLDRLICVINLGEIYLIYFKPDDKGLLYTPVTPCRIVDTRLGRSSIKSAIFSEWRNLPGVTGHGVAFPNTGA